MSKTKCWALFCQNDADVLIRYDHFYWDKVYEIPRCFDHAYNAVLNLHKRCTLINTVLAD